MGALTGCCPATLKAARADSRAAPHRAQESTQGLRSACGVARYFGAYRDHRAADVQATHSCPTFRELDRQAAAGTQCLRVVPVPQQILFITAVAQAQFVDLGQRRRLRHIPHCMRDLPPGLGVVHAIVMIDQFAVFALLAKIGDFDNDYRIVGSHITTNESLIGTGHTRAKSARLRFRTSPP